MLSLSNRTVEMHTTGVIDSTKTAESSLLGTLFDVNSQPDVMHVTPSNYILFPNLRTVYPMF